MAKQKDKGGRRTRAIEDRNLLGKLFPKAVSFLAEVLNDKLTNPDGTPMLDSKGKQIVASVAQKLDVATRVIDQHIGRPAQAVDLTAKVEVPPASTTEVVLTMEQPALDAPSEPAPGEPQPLPFEPTPQELAEAEEGWVDTLQPAVMLAGMDDSHPIFDMPAV